MTRVGIAADIEPRPTVKRAFSHARSIVRRKIVAEQVALVDDAPQFVAVGPDRQSGAVAQACREHAFVHALRIECEHVGTLELGPAARTETVSLFQRRHLFGRRARMPFGDVGFRAHRDIQRLAVRREHDVARPMASLGQIAHDGFGRAARLKVAGAIRVAQHFRSRRDIEPPRVGTGG